MKTRNSLLTGAAIGVVLAAGAAGGVQAKPARHRAAPDAASIAASQAAQIEALKAQVESLSERLLAQERQQQAVQAQVAQAQAAAETVRAEAAAQIKTIPAQVAKAAPPPKPSWADNTQISGRMYFDLTNVEHERDGTKIPPTGVGFDIKRFYVGVDHKFNDTFAGNITTDVQYNAAEGLTQVYIKKAYLQAKISDAAVVRLGSADLPWVPFAEDVYGYRFVENTVADRTKFGTSADWGVHLGGKLADGRISYAVAMIDGAGYKNPVRTKTMDFEGRVSANLDKVVLGLGGYSGKLGKDVEGGPPTPHRAERFNALAAYVDKRWRAGVEYFTAANWNNVTTAASDKSDGYSLFGAFNITPQVSTFARWDRVNPSKTLKPSQEDSYFNLGLNWEPVKTVDLAVVYKRSEVTNGLLSTSNGTIGGVRTGQYDELGLFGQFRW